MFVTLQENLKNRINFCTTFTLKTVSTNKYKYNFRNRKRNNTLIKILINVKLM